MAEQGVGRKRGEHRTTEESRRKILDSALKLAETKGFHGTTMAQLSKLSGMPAGSLYWHFSSKDNLFAVLFEEGVEARGASTGWWSLDSKESIREHLERFIGVRTGTLSPRDGIWRIGLILALEQSLDSPEARAMFMQIRGWLNGRICEWWTHVLGAEVVAYDPRLPQRLTNLMIATIDGYVISEHAGEGWDMAEMGQLLVDVLAGAAEHATKAAAASAGSPA